MRRKRLLDLLAAARRPMRRFRPMAHATGGQLLTVAGPLECVVAALDGADVPLDTSR